MLTYVDHMGCDESVCDAARVSMNKTADLFTVTQNERLINYLARHNHWSPFSHCVLKVRVTAPILSHVNWQSIRLVSLGMKYHVDTSQATQSFGLQTSLEIRQTM
jgi:thymidylate synthase ThyX